MQVEETASQLVVSHAESTKRDAIMECQSATVASREELRNDVSTTLRH
jgi:hypothetical protein